MTLAHAAPESTSPARPVIEPFRTMALLADIEARRKAGLPVYRLDLGEPSLPACRLAREAAAQSLLDGPQAYTPSRGRAEMRARLSQWYRDEYGVAVDPERIIVTAGASAALTLALLAGFEPGARIAVPRPGYPAYRNIIRALGRTDVEVVVGPDQDFRFGPAQLDGAGPLDGLLFASPANPTGTVLSAAQTAALVEAGAGRGLRVIADEIYQSMAFDQPAVTAASDERVLVVNSFSKFWRMTGWRLGWLVCPPDLVDLVDRLSQNLYLCPSSVAQTAALKALDSTDDARGALDLYRQNRDTVLAALANWGVTRIAPAEGAFYVYADFSAYTDDSLTFVKRLLNETGVAAGSGVDFDPVDGGSWLRFSTAGPAETVAQGIAIMGDWLARRG